MVRRTASILFILALSAAHAWAGKTYTHQEYFDSY